MLITAALVALALGILLSITAILLFIATEAWREIWLRTPSKFGRSPLQLMLIVALTIVALGLSLFAAEIRDFGPLGLAAIAALLAIAAFKGRWVRVSLLMAGAIMLGGLLLPTLRLFVNEDRFIEDAIRSSYEGIYGNLEELRKDYPGYVPKVRPWSDALLFWLGLGLYSVQLPEELVIVDANGVVKTKRPCGPNSAHCDSVAPVNPEFGVVGTVQYGPPDYQVAAGINVQWPGQLKGQILVSGHCFWAHADSPPTRPGLMVGPQGEEPARIDPGNGFFLVAITGGVRAQMRISKAEFEKSRSCSKEVRSTWPNIGGWAWKR